MTVQPRILFAGNFHWNAGSSHTIAEYARVAHAAGCLVGVSAELARMDNQVPAHLPLVDDLRWGTHLVLIFEGRQFLTLRQLEQCERIPRHRRLVVDPDGHWGPFASLGADDNGSGHRHASWLSLYRRLADVVLQPKAEGTLPDGAEFFPYFGMPPAHRAADDAPPTDVMDYQLQYIGGNWWRWKALADVITAALAAQPPVTRMRVCGRWWDGATCPGHEEASRSQPGWLAEHGVRVERPVPFGQVVSEMSRSVASPVLARPLLARLGMLTPRMFETPASGSIPLITADLAFLATVYGDEAAQLTFGQRPGSLVERVLQDTVRYRQLTATIQRRLLSTFSHERVLGQLLKFLQ